MCIADEIPFNIPDTWEWVRLGEIYQHNTGKALNASNRSGELLTYITTSNLYWNRFEIDSLREMYFSESEIEKCTATKGDLLVCEGGDIGRAAIWPYDTDIRIQNHIHRLRPYSEICTEYYYYIFFFYKHAGWIGGKGIGIQGLSANALHTLKRSVIEIIYTNHIEQHTARWFSAWLPPMQYTISGHQCTILIYLFISTTKNKRAVDQAFS